MSKALSKLFVYGTLKKGYHNHYIIEGSKLINTAVLSDYAIFDLGSFPGIVRDHESRVYGELYEISDDLLPRLDRLEGVPYLYDRATEVVVDSGMNVHTGVYVYVYQLDSGEFIKDGVWPEALSAA